jgi:hypothetical protein
MPTNTDIARVASSGEIQASIFLWEGERVILDAELARFYGVPLKALNQAVGRNRDRFPGDFCKGLTLRDTTLLKSQIVTSSSRTHGGARKPAYLFTEQGVAMMATVLRSKRAVLVSIAIIRAFVQMRELLGSHVELAAKLAELERKLATHDAAIGELFEAIRQLLLPAPADEAREIGFHTTIAKPPGT